MVDAGARERLRLAYPPLAALPATAFDALCTQARLSKVPRGAVLFDQSSACQAFPLVLEGSVRVVRVAESGREIALYRVTPGEACVLTSGCLLGGEPYGARGSAESDATLVLLPKASFDALIASEPAFREFVFALFGGRMRELMELVDAVAFRKLDQRLAGLLLGKPSPLRVTHQQLAEELGSVREIVSRILSHFADEGLVSLGRERIEVLDAGRLRKVAAGV